MLLTSVTLDAIDTESHRANGVAKNNKRGRGRPPVPGGSQQSIGLRPKQEIAAALKQYIDDQEVPPLKSSVIATALEVFLKDRGYLPYRPRPSDSGPSDS